MGDNLTFYNYFMMIKLIILSIVAYFFGLGAMIFTITLTVLFMFWVCSQFLGFNKGQILIIVALTGMLLYLAFGILWFKDFLVNNEPLTISFYIWAAIILAPMVVINIGNYINNPRRLCNIEIKKREKKRKKERAKNLKIYALYQDPLNIQFERSMTNIEEHQGFITLSEKAANHLQNFLPLSALLATFTAKLLVKTTTEGEFEIARIYLDSYINAIVPYAGLSTKSTDVASQGIALSIHLSDDDIYQRVEKHLLGENFDISRIKNEVLLFNLACHYSVVRDKENLLIATKYAMKHGMPVKKFFKDCDFEPYRNDKDFLAMLKEGSAQK